MSDEEKKKYEEIKYNNGYLYCDKEDVDCLIDIIEKQSKEIEELKAISEYREKIIKGLGLKTLPKTITGFRKLIENNNKKWEDKIKAKTEEAKKRYNDLHTKHLRDCGIAEQRELAKIEFGQSLLEKE